MSIGDSGSSYSNRRIWRNFSPLFPPNYPTYPRRNHPEASLLSPFLLTSHPIFDIESANMWPVSAGPWERFRGAELPNPSQASLSRNGGRNQAVDKLRKIVYNPMPKKLARRLCSYYKNRTSKENDSDESGTRCSVCLEDFEAKEVLMLTPCDHMFHEECIRPWLKSNSHCPVCRFILASNPPSSDRGATADEDFTWFLLSIEDPFVRGNPPLL